MMLPLFRVRCAVLRRKHFKGSTARYWRSFAAGFLFALAGILPALPANASTTAVGTLPGSFGVTPSGAATYTIPIALPRGSGGLTPSIALAYNSQSGSGAAGWGWTLAGLSTITRCNKTIDDDGVTQAVQLQSTDDYCLDGQRLRITNGGAEGGNQTTYDTELRGYSQITSYTGSPTGGPSYWTVQTKNGSTYEYGNTLDSKIYATNPGGGAQTAVRVWALDKVTDANTNYYTITYQNNDTTTGDYWPLSILYTGNAGASATPLHKVMFGWTPRSTQTIQASFIHGTLVTQTQLLSTITVSYNGGTNFIYTLTYQSDPATFRNQLESVQECDANSDCFPATMIGWQDGTAGWQSDVSTDDTVPDVQHANAAHLMDVNGDGIQDLVYPGATDWMAMFGLPGGGFGSPEDTGISASNYQYTLVMDYNGDGREDLMWPDTTDNLWHVLEATGNTTGVIFMDIATTMSDTGINSVTNEPIYEGNAMTADYHGNGLSDFIYSDGTNIYDVANTGGSFGTTTNIGSEGVISVPGIGIKTQPEFEDSPLDFDGSGRNGNLTVGVVTKTVCNQACQTTTTYNWYALASTNSGYSGVGEISAPQGDVVTPSSVDANGDGLSDLLWAGPVDSSGTYYWSVNLSTGTDLLEFTTTITDGGDGYPVIADYYGDGRQEMIVYDNNAAVWMLRLNYDLGVPGFVVQATSTVAPYPNSGGYDPGSLRVGNISGNGLDDLVYAEGPVGGAQTWHYRLHAGGATDLVTSITDGLGNTYKPQYVSLSASGGVYTEGTGAVYPMQDVQIPMQVVASYQASDGIGGQYTVSYSYVNGEQEVTGRGFLGFGTRTVTDSRNGVSVSDSYDQSYPFIGNLTNESVTQSNGKTLAATVNNYASSPSSCSGDALCFPYLSTSTVTVNDAGTGNPIKTVATQNTQPDSYGDLTNQTVTTTDEATSAAFTTTMATGYANDTTNYCIDLPTSVSVTKTSPGNSPITRTTNSPQDPSACRPASVTVNPGNTPTLTTAYTYDAYGNPATVTISGTNLPSDHLTITDYSTYQGEYPDSIEHCVVLISATACSQGLTSTETWDPSRGVETSMTDLNGHETQWGYDGFGRKTSESLPGGLALGFAYDACGSTLNGEPLGAPANCAYAVGETGNAQSLPVAATLYDAKGRAIEAEKWLLGGATSHVQTTYDSLGRAVAVSKSSLSTTPSYWTNTSYDVLNRPTQITAPANQGDSGNSDVTRIGYNAFTTKATLNAPGNPNVASETTTTVTDALGEAVSKTDGSEGALTTYTYDSFGDLVQTKDADNLVTQMWYDALSHKYKMTDPNMGTWTYGVDALGEVLTQTDADGNAITQDYDALGRLTSRTEKNSSGTITANDTWSWDSAANGKGMLASESDSVSGFLKAYTYDNLSRPSEVDTTIPGTSTPYAVNTSYDSFGRVAAVTYPASVAPGAPVASAVASPTSAVVGSNITLNGSGSTDPNGLTLSYQWSGPSGLSIANPAVETTTVTSSTPGAYTVQLVVSDQNATSSPATAAVTFTPPEPGAPSTSPNPSTTGSYAVSWSAVSGASSYELYESTDGTNYGDLASVSGTSDSLSGKSDGSYYYKVAACENGVCGPLSAASSVESVLLPPAAPTNLTASPNPSTNGSYTLSWTAPAEPVTAYNIYNSSGGFINSTTGTSASFGGIADGTYSYYVKACNQTACGPASNTASETVLHVPGTPSSISLSPTSIYQYDSYTLSWGSASGTVSNYEVNGSTSYSASTFSASYTKFKAGNYTYYVQACNSSGCGPATATVTETVLSGTGGCKTCSPTTSPQTSSPSPSSPTPAPSASSGGGWTGAVVENLEPDGGYLGPVTTVAQPSLQQSAVALASEASSASSVPPFGKGGRGGISDESGAPGSGTASGVLLALARTRYALTPQLFQPSEMQMQAAANTRERALLPSLLPPASDKDVAAWNAWDIAHRRAYPNGPEFAPPEYIAYANAKLEPASGSSYRFEVQYNYDSASGALVSAANAQTGFVYWQAATGGAAPVDAFGHLLGWTDGNNVSTVMAYDAATGAPVGISSGIGQSSAIQSLIYTWDGFGNLEQRCDANRSLAENVTNDDLNRLTGSTVYTGASVSGSTCVGGSTTNSLGLGYDAMGNITNRTVNGTVETYTPDSNHPYAVASVSNSTSQIYSASYDADGNMTTRNGYQIQWTPSSLPESIASATGSSTFGYDLDHARYYQSATFNGATTDTTYVGGLFEVVSSSNGTTEYRHNIVADGQVIAVHTIDGNGAASTDYLHYDHLGSVDTITNDQGTVIQSMSFDAFGLRRDATNWDYDLSQNTLATLKNYTDRGYTDQEQLDNLSLVDMNGRVYDPTVGKFISADPMVPGNRYAYVDDNPLRFTDPSGYCIFGCIWQPGKLAGIIGGQSNLVDILLTGLPSSAWRKESHYEEVLAHNRNVQLVAAVALAAYTGGASLLWLEEEMSFTAFWATVGEGAVAGGVFSGSMGVFSGQSPAEVVDETLRGAAIGAVGAGMLYGANALTAYAGNNFAVGFVSHGVAGGLTSEAAGGSFNKGFELGAFAYSAYTGYQHIVNGEAPSWNSGNGVQMKSNPNGSPWCGCQENTQFTNIGFANTTPAELSNPGFFYEGGTLSNALNAVPGMNAIATLHDVMMDSVSASWFDVLNVPFMPVAATATLTGLMNTTVGYSIIASKETNGGGP